MCFEVLVLVIQVITTVSPAQFFILLLLLMIVGLPVFDVFYSFLLNLGFGFFL